jgi:hypothetical protein
MPQLEPASGIGSAGDVFYLQQVRVVATKVVLHFDTPA